MENEKLEELGASVRGWRKIIGLTADQLCQRANISRPTLRKLETGSGAVSVQTLLSVLQALGIQRQMLDALDPLNSELGRLRVDALARERVR